MKAVVDNDILIKGVGFGLLSELLGVVADDLTEIGILGASRFIIRRRFEEYGFGPRHLEDRNLITSLEVLEPTEDEQELAAELEFFAMRRGLELDEGESLLCAATIFRRLCSLATGDKRAIRAIDLLREDLVHLNGLEGKIVCLEQLFLRLAKRRNPAELREHVCRSPSLDRALAICFSCNGSGSVECWLEGLRSYIASLRSSAAFVLAE